MEGGSRMIYMQLGVILNPPGELSMACASEIRKSRKTASRRTSESALALADRADIRLVRQLFGWIVGPAGLGFAPAAVGAFVLPRMHLQIAPIKEVVAAGDAAALAFGARAGGSSAAGHGM